MGLNGGECVYSVKQRCEKTPLNVIQQCSSSSRKEGGPVLLTLLSLSFHSVK